MMARISALVLALSAAVWADEGYCDLHRFKVKAGGGQRKAGLYVPKNLKKNEILPLLVAIPGTQGKAMRELGQWEKDAYEKRFAIVSVDAQTCLVKGWLPSEQRTMQDDMEAVTDAIEQTMKTVAIDQSAVYITGFSGGTYLTFWMGLRRPDLFQGIIGRACLRFDETVPPSKYDKFLDFTPNKQQQIFLYHGTADVTRAAKETKQLQEALLKAGYANVTHQLIKGMGHESKFEIAAEWFAAELKRTAKTRKAAAKIAADVKKLRAKMGKGKPPYSKIEKLAEKEAALGIRGDATKLLAEVLAEPKKALAEAKEMEASDDLIAAATAYKQIERSYGGSRLSKQARAERSRLVKSDAYKADEIYREALSYREEGDEEKAVATLEKLAKEYPETPAGKKARDEIGG